jgi:hypothetical protein
MRAIAHGNSMSDVRLISIEKRYIKIALATAWGGPAMSVVSKIAALIEALRREPDAFATMRPADRLQLAQVCRFIADKADPPKSDGPKAGVLADLSRGQRSE